MTQATEITDFPIPRTTPFNLQDGYLRLRDNGAALQRVRLYDGELAWVVTRLEQATQLLTDRRLSSDKQRPGYPAFRPAEKASRPFHTLIEMDSPEHERNRRMLMPAFTVRAVQKLRPEIQRAVDACIDEMLAGPKPVDLMQALAIPVPGEVISHLLGISKLDHEAFMKYTRRLYELQGEEELHQVLREFMGLLNSAVANLEREPEPGLLSELIRGPVAAGEMTRDYLIVTALFLLIAGHQPVSAMVGLGVLTLLEHPDQMGKLLADPSKIPAAVNELNRFLSPTDLSGRRVAREDIEIAGVTIRAGEGVVLPSLLINRDADAFPDPDSFNVERAEARQNIGYGHGAHRCIGDILGNVELEVIIETLFRRVPTLKLAANSDELPLNGPTGPHGVRKLPVSW